MKVITNAPILTNVSGNYDIASADFSGANGTRPSFSSSRSPSSSDVEKAKREGFDWDKATGNWKKVQDSGVLDFISGLVGKGRQNQSQYNTGNYPPLVPVDDTKEKEEGMSTGMKIGLAIGGVAVVGAIIYFATRKK
jgi:hypothetical protein